jgi:hypothetical protein
MGEERRIRTTAGGGRCPRRTRSLRGSRAGSHTDERLCNFPDFGEHPAESCLRPRTDLNGPECLYGYLRIRRSRLWPQGRRVVAWLRSGDGPLSVRARPSSIKRDCGRRATSTGEKLLVNVHAKSRLTPEPLRALRSEAKGQAGACPDRTRAIPCKVQVRTCPRDAPEPPSTASPDHAETGPGQADAGRSGHDQQGPGHDGIL